MRRVRATIFLMMQRVVIRGLCAGALASAACADGPETATSASASAPAGSSAALASSPRSGELHVEKGCPPPGFTGQANDFCTITSSNSKAIEVGSRVVYASALENGVLDSDVRLVVGPGNTAFGHCHLGLGRDVQLHSARLSEIGVDDQRFAVRGAATFTATPALAKSRVLSASSPEMVRPNEPNTASPDDTT